MSDQTADPMRGWWSRLFGGGARTEAAQRLVRVERQLAELSRQVEALRAAVGQAAGARPDHESLQQALLGLEKQVGRAGREQLKANSIAEAQAAQLAAALEQLRAAGARREDELNALRAHSHSAQVAARLELVQDILPALDGLDEALRAGQPLLAAARQPRDGAEADDESGAGARAEPAPGGWLRWLLGESPPASAGAPRDAALRQVAELRDGLESWLHGLVFVRQRLLDMLAAQGVRPIVAAGHPFDPKNHIAIGVVPATEDHPTGVVVEELRRGYMVGERVLRHAEVVVASGEERRLEEQQEGAPA